MPNYRRYTIPGAAVFFTVVTHERRRFLTEPRARRCLREAIRIVRARHPFEISAFVLLPDHLHAIWILPRGDHEYSLRWKRIKGEFTERYLAFGGEEGTANASRNARRERGVWQRRFWEHTIRDEDDFERHIDYIHYNPVKHGLAECPSDWEYSSFHRYVSRQAYPRNWGCSSLGSVPSNLPDDTAME
jgi:putative transposase